MSFSFKASSLKSVKLFFKVFFSRNIFFNWILRALFFEGIIK